MAQTLLPNIRRTIRPDPGFTLVDVDLSGADAQVVAWETDDAVLKAAFKAGKKIHIINATDMWGDDFTRLDPDSPEYKKKYDEIKQGVHLTNYGGRPRTMAQTLGITEAAAKAFQARWFHLHPNIRRWHQETERQLLLDGRITNILGYSIKFSDRIGEALTKALAWKPQSTVALVTFLAAQKVDEVFNPTSAALGYPSPSDPVQWLLQVHDSLVFQIRTEAVNCLLPQIIDLLAIPLPYPGDPLTISWGVATSTTSWGDLTKWQTKPSIPVSGPSAQTTSTSPPLTPPPAPTPPL